MWLSRHERDREKAEELGRQQMLLELLREERASAAAQNLAMLTMVQKMSESVAAQTNVFGDYLKMIQAVPATEPRIMTDGQEREFERLAAKRRGLPEFDLAPMALAPPMDAEQMLEDLRLQMGEL